MSTLVDAYGRPLSNTLYKTPSQRSGDFRPVPHPRPKTYEAVSAWQRREMVDVSRVIAAGVPNIDTALLQAGEFSIGDSWHIKSRGGNKGWSKKRDEWFNCTYARNCNANGTMNDWRSTLRQLNWTRKVEGDYAIVFDGAPWKDSTGKEHTPTGQFKVIKYDRINSGLNGACAVGNGLEQVKEIGRNSYASYFTNGWGGWIGMYIINDPASPFDGMRIIDGVIVDADMRVAGYRVVGFTESGMPIYCDVPRERIHFNFGARKHVDMIRGFPELAEAILPSMGLDDIQYLVTMAIKLASAMAVTRESADGRPNTSGVTYSTVQTTTEDEAGVVSTKSIVNAVQEIYPGIYELAVNNKEAIKQFNFNRPSMNEEAWIARIETSLLHKLWPRSLIYVGDSARAGTRSVAVQANTICQWDQQCLERSARWIGDRATEFAMRAGYIPGNNQLADPYNYVFTVPGKFTVDEGNDMKMRLLALGRCCISHGLICELDGYSSEEIYDERFVEIDRILTGAEQLAEKHAKFDAKEIALMFDHYESNISFADNAQINEEESKTGVPGQPAGAAPAQQPKP